MITIYEPNENNFTDNGLAVLEPNSCVLSVTINGKWVLELEHPFDKAFKKFRHIKEGYILRVDNIPVILEQEENYQLFRIYNTENTLRSVKAVAFPVAFEANCDAIIEELKTAKKTATATLADVSAYLTAQGVTKYTIKSDYTQAGVTARQEKGSWEDTNLMEVINGTGDNSIVSRWGGEVAFDNYNIIVNGRLGRTGTASDDMNCNPAFRFTDAFWHSQAYESGYHQQDYNYKKATGEDAIIAIDSSHNFMLVSCISPTAVDWVWQRLEYDSTEGAWVYGAWQDPIYNDVYGLYTPCYRESSFTYKGKTWWVSWGYMDTYYNTPFVTASHVLDGRSTGDIVGNAKALIDIAQWSPVVQTAYDIRYGKNMTGMSYNEDSSGVITRLYPKSADGVRLSWSPSTGEPLQSFVDSARIGSYAYIRSAFVKTDYKLVDTSYVAGEQNNDTAIATHSAQEAITEMIRGVASRMWDSITTGEQWRTKWYEPEWVKDELNDIIKTLQENLITEWGITHPTLKNIIQNCIKEGIGWIKDEDIDDFYWEEIEEGSGYYQYTNGVRVIKSQYAYIDRRYCYFNASGVYEPWKDVSSMDWIQSKNSNAKKKYGNNQRYYAQNETVYTMGDDGEGNRQFNEYYFDSDGWWDGVSNTASSWDWHEGSGGKWWFGETDADSESKYAHDCWLYIKATDNSESKRYYFDSEGYSVSALEESSDWAWRTKENRDYFGSTTKSQNAVYLRNQWMKIEGEWRKFNDSSLVSSNKALFDQITNLLQTAIIEKETQDETVADHVTELYTLLYNELVEYCQRKYTDDEVDLPAVNITVDVIDLYKAKGYEDILEEEELKGLHLGDDVNVLSYEHGYNIKERVVSLQYDVLRGYNTAVTIDKTQKNLAQMIRSGGSNGGSKNQELVAGEGIDITNGVIGVNFLPSGNSFGGSQVVVEPTVVGGTKIADIYVNGTPHSIYGDGDTKYSAGANIQISQQGVISATDTTYNDFAGSAHGLVPAVGSGDSGYLKTDGSWDEPEGTAVEANPTGTATETLSTILIDDTIYDIQGGGTNVEANPSGEPTDTLLSVKIGNVIYDIPSGEVTTDIKEYNPQKYTFMYESGQDAAFSTLDGDMQIQTVLDPSYAASDYKAEIVRVVPIPTTVKKIRYRLEFGYQTYRESNTDEWKYCVGVKSTLDTTNYASPTDNDFIVKKLYSKEDYENSIIDDELILDGTTQTYLYFIGRGWNCEITKLESVEVGTVMELSGLDDVNITNPSNGQTIVFNGTSGKWENQTPSGGGGSTITYGTSEPSGSANDGDVYYLLQDDKLKATFLYKINQWILIDGNVGLEGVRIWTHSTGGNDASMWLQHGYYNPSTGVFTPDQNEIDVKYQDVYQRETTYYDMVSLYYGNWQCKAKTEMTDGTNTYSVGSTIKSWQYYESVDFTVWKTT